MSDHPRTVALIAAAGNSTRMGQPKQMILLGGKPVIVHTLPAFQRAALVDEVILIAREEDRERFADLFRQYALTKVSAIVCGGDTRTESMDNGLATLDGQAEYLVFHDGARPLIRPAMIDDALRVAYEHQAVLVAVPVKDTVKVSDEDGFVAETPPRERLWNSQTPQIFRRDLYVEARARAALTDGVWTDDSQIVEAAGYAVRLFRGDYTNIKITTPEDILLAESILRERGEIT